MARFLGYDGEIRQDGELLLTRPVHISLDADGPLDALVLAAIPTQDGTRLRLELQHGTVHAFVPHPGPHRGETVRVRIDGGVTFTDRNERVSDEAQLDAA